VDIPLKRIEDFKTKKQFGLLLILKIPAGFSVELKKVAGYFGGWSKKNGV